MSVKSSKNLSALIAGIALFIGAAFIWKAQLLSGETPSTDQNARAQLSEAASSKEAKPSKHNTANPTFKELHNEASPGRIASLNEGAKGQDESEARYKARRMLTERFYTWVADANVDENTQQEVLKIMADAQATYGELFRSASQMIDEEAREHATAIWEEGSAEQMLYARDLEADVDDLLQEKLSSDQFKKFKFQLGNFRLWALIKFVDVR